MEIVPLIVILLLVILVAFPIWAIIRIVGLGRENNAFAERLLELEAELRQLRQSIAVRRTETSVEPAARPAPPAAVPSPVPPPSRPLAAPPSPVAAAPVQPQPVPATPLPPAPKPEPVVLPPPVVEPPPLTYSQTDDVVEPPPRLVDRINWEHFMGAKLFAWIGGFAALLGVAYFLKYSFEHDLIPPEVRVAMGFVFAIGLVIGGLKLPRERYSVLAQSLIATGIVCLYAVTFACNSVYHFAFFGPIPTFLLMSLITGTAFLLAVRLEARVIAVLGILGGFLTPVLLSTGKDNPPGLFGYLALLDLGLIAVALHRRWAFLVALGAGGTAVMQVGWALKFFNSDKAYTAAIVCLAFCAVFLAAYFLARRVYAVTSELPDESGDDEASAMAAVPQPISVSAAGMVFVAFGFAFVFVFKPLIAIQPGFLFTFVLLADLCLLAIAWRDELLPRVHLAGGIAVFALLAVWTVEALTPPLLPWALGFYLLYAALHTTYPLLLERRRPEAAPPWWSQLFPPLTLLLLLGPVLKLDEISLLFWPAVLAVDAMAVVLAAITGSILVVAIVLVLTLLATAVWIFGSPISLGTPVEQLFVVGGFAVLFFAATVFLGRKLGLSARRLGAANPLFGDARSQLPAFSALMPFLLLILMTVRLSPANPSPVFGLALLLVVLTLGLSVIMVLPWLPICALAGTAALEYVWHTRGAAAASPAVPLVWYLGFYALFAAFPFVFRRRFASATGPWAVSALAGVVQFPLVYRLVQHAWPNEVMGLLPAAFAVASTACLLLVLQQPPPDEKAKLNQLAWYGGVALLFITLIFPIQFERQWLTLSWALEGLALVWLYHRVPHAGLRATGVVLLVVAFVRLALNPAVLEYHERSEIALLNWFLYSYGIVTIALYAASRLLAPPRNEVLGVNTPPLLNTLGTILAFLLLNIQIADFFSVPGTRVLTFQFSGNFARDMSYTIGWSLFALVLLLVSIWKQQRAGRIAALALLGVAVLKLFFHDLARLETLYKIGALFGVAIIATLASFAYQRFLPNHDKATTSDT